MVYLTQIDKQNGTISCNYSPENSGEIGRLSIDVATGDFLEAQKTAFDLDTDIYIAKAKFKLLDLALRGFVPAKSIVAWY